MNKPSRWMLLGMSAVLAASARVRAADPPSLPATPTMPTSPMPFFGVTPCRIVDTRDPSRGPAYGPPALLPSIPNPRSFPVLGQCGIPTNAQALSLNVTVVNPQGLGYVQLYPEGGPQPVVSTLNYLLGQTVANAAIVPVGDNGGIIVAAAVSGTDLLIDTNGYFGPSQVGFTNTFVGEAVGATTTTGNTNTGMGDHALASLTSGGGNTAIGSSALFQTTTGSSNTAVGVGALYSTTTGFDNTAVGPNALGNNPTGSSNIAIGRNAGSQLTAGDGNIYIGSPGGPSNEGGTIRIGFVQNKAFFEGIRGRTTGLNDAVPVFIDSVGQLGTLVSSARFKEDIRDMGDASSGLLSLRPVTFRYKSQIGGPAQYGLVAEEVERILPDLVVRDAHGEVETVLYHELPAMLLNEIQKQERQIQELEARLATLEGP